MVNEVLNKPIYDPIYYPPRPGLVIPEVIVPRHRQSWMSQARDMRRYVFQGYEDLIVIIDNLEAHFQRGDKRIQVLEGLKESEKYLISSHWQVHDVGEIELSADRTIVDQKHNEDKDAAKKFDQIEEEAARRLLTSDDLLLWEEFESAKAAINNKGDGKPVSPEAVMARVIDAIDGEMTFHFWFVELKKELGERVYNYFPPGAFHISFPRNRQYREGVRRLNMPKKYINLTDQMFDEVVAYAKIAGQREV